MISNIKRSHRFQLQAWVCDGMDFLIIEEGIYEFMFGLEDGTLGISGLWSQGLQSGWVLVSLSGLLMV